MVGTKKALAYAVRNVTVTKRNTLLKERLSGKLVSHKKQENIIYPEFGNASSEQLMVAEEKSFYGNKNEIED